MERSGFRGELGELAKAVGYDGSYRATWRDPHYGATEPLEPEAVDASYPDPSPTSMVSPAAGSAGKRRPHRQNQEHDE